MEETFCVTGPRLTNALSTQELISVYRDRWVLVNRVAALEAALREQADVTRELRARLSAAEFQQRELLMKVALVTEDCGDTIRLEAAQLNGADPIGPAVRIGRRWHRRVERIQAKLESCLSAQGISLRVPKGAPNPELDVPHSFQETNAAPPGEIVEVLRPAILWNGSLLRNSIVIVAVPHDPSNGPPS